MNETVVCPNCRRLLQLSPDHMGKMVQCPNCETMFIAGAANPPPHGPSPAASDAVTATRAPAPVPRDVDDVPRSRRSRRLDTRKPTTGRKPWQTLLIIGIAITVGGGFVLLPAIIAIMDGGNRKPPMNFVPAIFNVVPPPPPVDVPDRMLTPEEQQTHAKLFFDHFSAVMRNSADLTSEKDCFDTNRLLDTAFDEKLIPAARQNDRACLLGEFREGVLQTSLYRGANWWMNYEIKSVKQFRARELIAFTRHTTGGTDNVIRLRWWLAHCDGRWLVTEVECFDYGVRLSMLLAGGLQQADPAVLALRDAANAVVVKVDFNECDRILGTVRVDALPRAGAAIHHLLTASIRTRQRRFEETLTACTAAEHLEPDMPGNDYLLAITYNSLPVRRPELALKHACAAHGWLGDDPDICYALCLSLGNQSRFAEAAPLYRKTLAARPNHKDAFISLLRCIVPGAKNDDIGARLLKMQNPENHFQEFAQDCWLVRDSSTLRSLADAMLTRMPRHADSHFYLALVHAEEERLPAARASFRTALECQDFEPRRGFYHTEFARTVVSRDQALQAYRALPQQRVFRTIGEALRIAYKLDDLQELVDLHAKIQPKDAYVDLFVLSDSRRAIRPCRSGLHEGVRRHQ